MLVLLYCITTSYIYYTYRQTGVLNSAVIRQTGELVYLDQLETVNDFQHSNVVVYLL